MQKEERKSTLRLWVIMLQMAFILPMYSGVTEHVVSLNLGEINYTGTTILEITDPLMGDISGDYTYQVRLVYGRQGGTDIYNLSSVWDLELTYTANGTNHTLEIDNIYKVRSINIHEENTPDFSIEISWPTLTLSGQILADIQVELVQIKRTSNCDTEYSDIQALHKKEDTYAMIYWPFLKEAEEYELEWVYVDAEDNNYNQITSTKAFNHPYLNSQTIEGRHYKEPVNIITSEAHYNLYMSYPSGSVYYRVRGLYYDDTGLDCAGRWSGVGRIDICESSCEFDVFEGTKTWQEVTTYAEEGKHKKVISYKDGISRGRQTLANLSTEKMVVVTEQLYDYEGRASVQVLPMALSENSLEYVSLLNKNLANGGYGPADFDKSSGAEEMSHTSGAAKYYSPQSEVNSINKSYIPNSQGYPFTQIVYLRDGTGRPKSVSGVGENMQIGSGKETKYYYASTNERELRRLFGKNVGHSSHYRKNSVKDANGQMSVTYIDQTGRVIATALTGDTVDNLLSLERNAENIKVDLMEGDNVIFSGSQTSELLYKHLNTVPNSTVYFEYDFSGKINQFEIDEESYCLSCVYELEIYIKDEEGINIELNGDEVDAQSRKIKIELTGEELIELNQSTGKPNCETAPGQFLKNLTFNATFAETGVYTVYKRVRLTGQSLKEQFQKLLDYLEGDDILEAYIFQHMSQIDYSNCNVTCDQHFNLPCIHEWNEEHENDLIYPETFSSSHNGWEYVQSCIHGYCQAIIETIVDEVSEADCESLLAQMMRQVDGLSGYYSSRATWWNHAESELEAVYNLTGGYTSAEKSEIGIRLFIVAIEYGMDVNILADESGWKDVFNEIKNDPNPTEQGLMVLAFFHPEYCHYKSCISNIESNNYDVAIKLRNNLTVGSNSLYYGAAQNFSEPIPYNNGYVPTVNTSLASDPNYPRMEGDPYYMGYTKAGGSFIHGKGEDYIEDIYNELYVDYRGIVSQGQALTGFSNYITNNKLTLWEYYSPYNMQESNYYPPYGENYNTNSPKIIPHLSEDLLHFNGQPNCYIPNTSDPCPVYSNMDLYYSDIDLGAPDAMDQIKARHWSLWREAYSALKMRTERDRRIQEGCAYVDGNHAVVKDIELSENFEESNQAAANQLSEFAGEICIVRVNEMRTRWMTYCSGFENTTSGLSLEDNFNIYLEPLFYGYCHSNVGLSNPLGIIQSHEWDTDPNLQQIEAYVVNYESYHDCLGCEAKIAHWKNILYEQCGVEAYFFETELESYFENYCDANPALKNPFRNITHIDFQDQNIQAITTSLGNGGYSDCSDLSSIIVPDLYTYAIHNGDTVYHEQCRIDPCVQSFLEYARLEVYPYFTDPDSNAYFSDNTGFLMACQASAWAVLSASDTFFNDVPHNFMYMDFTEYDLFEETDSLSKETTTCYRYYSLVSENDYDCCVWGGAWVDEHGSPDLGGVINGILSYEIDTESPLDSAQIEYLIIYEEYPESFNYLNIKARLLLLNGDTVDAWLFEAMDNCNIINPATCKTTPIVSGWTEYITEGDIITTTLSDWQDACYEQLIDEAHYYAHESFREYLDSLYGAFISQTKINCMDIEESFVFEYELDEHHYTLYYYDQAGNLTQTVPPLGVMPLDDSNFTDSGRWNGAEPNHDLQSQYHYNTLNQVIWQKTPDGGESRFWYDKKGQLVYSENSKQKTAGNLSFTEYDNLGRVIKVGEINANINADYSSIAAAVHSNNISGNIPMHVATYYGDSEIPYPVESENSRGRVALTMTIEDNGRVATALAFDYDQHGNVKSFITFMNDMGMRAVEYEYDLISGNVKKVSFQPEQMEQFSHRYEYDADNRLTNVYTSYDGIIWEEDAEYFYYPHGPLARIELGEDKIQGLDYYYTLQGWLKGINNPNEGVTEPGRDGYLSINNNLNSKIARDGYSMHLGYYEGDYLGIGGVSIGENWTGVQGQLVLNTNKGLYNGNIAYMAQNIAPDHHYQTELASGSYRMAVYQYDQLNRIKQSKSGFIENQQLAFSDKFKSTYRYDANGNLTHLTRKNKDGDIFDDFTYNYNITQAARNNQLRSVYDVSSAADGLHNDITAGQSIDNYEYDEIGNLIADESEDIAEITWNFIGKVDKVIRKNSVNKPNIQYHYNALGQLIAKQIIKKELVSGVYVEAATGMEATIYSRDIAGNVLAMYVISFDDMEIEMEYPIYGSSRIGVARKELIGFGDNYEDEVTVYFGDVIVDVPPLGVVSEGDLVMYNGEEYYVIEEMGNDKYELMKKHYISKVERVLGNKYYELANHLGNVMVVVTDRRKGIDDRVQVIHDNFVTGTGDFEEYGGATLSNTGGQLEIETTTGGSGEGVRAIIPQDELPAGNDLIVNFHVEAGTAGTIYIDILETGGSSVLLQPYSISGTGNVAITFPLSNYTGSTPSFTIKVYGQYPGIFTVQEIEGWLMQANGELDYYIPDVVSATDYYPFGSPMPGRIFSSESYDYGFNGQLKVDEISGVGNNLDFGARIYDSRLGRWFSRDPLAAYFPSMSPYQFAGNSPILMVDVGGNENMIYLYVSPCLNIDNEILLAKVKDVFAKVIAVNNLNVELGVKLVNYPMEKEFLDDTDVSAVVGYVRDLNEFKFDWDNGKAYPHNNVLQNGIVQGSTPKILQFPSYTFHPDKENVRGFKISPNVIDQLAWTIVHEAFHRMQQNFENDKIKEMGSDGHVIGANEDNPFLMGDGGAMFNTKGMPGGDVNTWDDAFFKLPDDWNNFMNFNYGRGGQMHERNGDKVFKRTGQGQPKDNASDKRNGGNGRGKPQKNKGGHKFDKPKYD